jgi:magnesium chelatase subunit I
MAITAQEAWIERTPSAPSVPSVASVASVPSVVPGFVREIVEEVAFQARGDRRVDKRSGVSQRLPISTLESVVSNAERRALVHGEAVAVPRVSDVYASLPALTGKLELEYEGELKGAEDVAREIVRTAVATVFEGLSASIDPRPIIDWFERGGTLDLSDATSAADLLEALAEIDGLPPAAAALGAGPRASDAMRAAVAELILEGLCALKKISRTEDGRLHLPARAAAAKPASARDRDLQQMLEEDEEPGTRSTKKKYYN